MGPMWDQLEIEVSGAVATEQWGHEASPLSLSVQGTAYHHEHDHPERVGAVSVSVYASAPRAEWQVDGTQGLGVMQHAKGELFAHVSQPGLDLRGLYRDLAETLALPLGEVRMFLRFYPDFSRAGGRRYLVLFWSLSRTVGVLPVTS